MIMDLSFFYRFIKSANAGGLAIPYRSAPVSG